MIGNTIELIGGIVPEMKANVERKQEEFLPFALPLISEREIQEVVDTLQSGWITLGPKTKRFEKHFRNYIGSKHAIAVNSCTAGLHLSLVAAEIGEGCEVITTPFTFAATSHVILHVGAKPVFVDVDKNTCNIDVNQIKEVINSKTKAIMPVHFAGHPCDMNEIMSIAQKYGLFVIEDAAHALAAKYYDQNIGNIGDMTSFSFYATKNITTGEGGMVTTNNDDLAEKIRLLSLHGISKDAWKRYSADGNWFYDVVCPGYKYNMSDIQAALGLWQLEMIDQFQNKRQEYARIYNKAFQDLPEIEIPYVKDGIEHAWHLYVIRLNLDLLKIDRNDFIKALYAENIGTSVHFIPLHLHSFYRKRYGFKYGDFPNSEYLYQRVISLPLYPKMAISDVERVIEAVKKVIKQYRRSNKFRLSNISA